MEVTPELRLKRFLHFTSEKNIHHPGSRFDRHFYAPENLPSLGELITAGKCNYVFGLIEKVINQHSTPYPEAALFVLAECAKVKELKPKALEMARKLCSDSALFILFIKFAIEKSPSIGTGRQFRKFVQDWYLEKDAFILAALIAEKPRFKGWRHCDILKLSHLSTKKPEHAAVIKYAFKGVDAMKQEYGSEEGTQEIIEFLEVVEKCRKEENPRTVASYVLSHMLAIEHCNYRALKDVGVWTALLHQLPVKTLMEHFHLLCKYKLFRLPGRWNNRFIEAVCETFSKPCAKLDGVGPNKVFIELINYENAGRIKCDLSAKLQKKPRRAPNINKNLSKALENLMYRTLQRCESTNKSVVVLVDKSLEMVRRRCRGARWVTLAQAAAFLCLYWLRTEPSARLCFYSQEQRAFQPARRIDRVTSIKNMIKALEVTPAEQTPGSTTHQEINKLTPDCIHTAVSNFKRQFEVDLCIVLTHFIDCHTFADPPYDTEKKIKFAFINLGGNPPENPRLIFPDTPNILIVSGFDEHTAKLITEFAKHSF